MIHVISTCPFNCDMIVFEIILSDRSFIYLLSFLVLKRHICRLIESWKSYLENSLIFGFAGLKVRLSFRWPP